MNFIPKIEYIERITLVAKTIDFTSPPEGDPFDEKDKVVKKSRRSVNGTLSTQLGYILREFGIEFLFQPKSVKLAFQDFWNNHAIFGEEFNYFTHNDEVEFDTFTIAGSSQKYERPIPDDADDFEYNFKFKIERAL